MYIDEAYLQAAFGTSEVAALCPSSGELATTIELAEAEVESALLVGGFPDSVPSSVYASTADVPKQIKLAAYGAWLQLAFGRRGRALPETLRAFPLRVEDLRLGRLRVDATPDAGTAVGGVMSTETSASVTAADGSRPPVFDRATMGGF